MVTDVSEVVLILEGRFSGIGDCSIAVTYVDDCNLGHGDCLLRYSGGCRGKMEVWNWDSKMGGEKPSSEVGDERPLCMERWSTWWLI